MIKNIFTKTRWLVTFILLTTLSIYSAWGTDPQLDLRGKTTALTLPKANSATSYSAGDWRVMAPNATNKSQTGTVTQSAVTYGTIYFYLTGDANTTESGGYPLGFTSGSGYLTTTILSDYGVDITIRWKSKTSGKVEASLTGASTIYSDEAKTWQNKQISTTSTSATLRIGSKSDATDASGVSYIIITPKSGSCSEANPTIGTASLNGSFNMTSTTSAIGVSSGTCGAGTSCSWQDYGFVWSDGTNTTTPTVSNNKVQVGTSGTATSWTGSVTPSGSTTPTSWTTGHTYYVRTYAKNNKSSAEFKYGSAWSFTPQSITFYGNGSTGGSMNTQYVRNSVSTALTANGFSKTGYSFAGWATTSSGSVAYANQASVNIDADLEIYAKWTANPYTITLNNQSATTAGSANISVTYDSNTNLTGTPAITVPKKTGYTFGGYYTSTGGSGVQIIDADGNVVASAGGGSTYTDASKNWKYANDIELYAKWTIKNYTITWKVNGETWTPKTTTGEGTDGSDNANYNTAWSTLTLPTDPGASELTSCVADKFMGWTESENYESDSAPTDLLNSGNKASKTSKKITKNTTFYAVFADYGE